MKLSELEVKIALDSQEHFQRIFEKCQRLYGNPSHLHQLDEYYDSHDNRLRQQDLVIRIRTHGNQQSIALKSPRVLTASGMSDRIELEFLAADAGKVHEQLHQQGLKAYEAIEKERWTFMHGECEIVLDKLPFIGFFIEVEGPSEEAIIKILQALSLSSSTPITKNYGELLRDRFQELKLSLDSMHATFQAEKALYRT